MASKQTLGLMMALMATSAIAQQPSTPIGPAAAAVSESAAKVETAAPVPPPPVAMPAEPAPMPTPGVATLGDLDRIQSQTLMAEARMKLATANQALADAQGVALPGDESKDAPVVAGVFGSVERPYAKFLIPGGGQVPGRVGDLLPGGFRVMHVGIDKVVIRDQKGRQVVARFSGTLPTRAPDAPAQTAQNVAPAGGLPIATP